MKSQRGERPEKPRRGHEEDKQDEGWREVGACEEGYAQMNDDGQREGEKQESEQRVGEEGGESPGERYLGLGDRELPAAAT